MATTIDRVQRERDRAETKILAIVRSLEELGVSVDDINLKRSLLVGQRQADIVGIEIMVSVP